MKNKNRITLSVIIILIITICFMSFSANATVATEVNDVETQMKELQDYCMMCIQHLQEGMIGSPILHYTSDSKAVLEDAVIKAWSCVDAYYVDKEDITSEEIQMQMDSLESAFESLVLQKKEISFLTLVVENENNSRGYYSDELWVDFTEKYEEAEAVYADETITDTRITDAYWNLYFSYNNLCLSNMMSGDIDGDGKVTILDVTLLQKSLVKMYELNSSQIFVANVTNDGNMSLDINDATTIQKYVVKMDDNESWGFFLNSLHEQQNVKWWDTNRLFQKAMTLRSGQPQNNPYLGKWG